MYKEESLSLTNGDTIITRIINQAKAVMKEDMAGNQPLYSTTVYNLDCSHLFCSSLSIMSFGRPKGPKGPARGKSSPPFLCSGVAGRHPSVEKVLPLEPFC